MLQLDVYIIVHVRKHMVKWSELKDTMSNSGMDARKGGDSLSLVTLHITGIQFFFKRLMYPCIICVIIIKFKISKSSVSPVFCAEEARTPRSCVLILKAVS